MGLVTIDFETYYDQDCSLSKMRETEYLLDPRFEAIMCAVKVGRGPTSVHYGREMIARAFSQIDWSTTALLSHNMRFDGAIAAWHFGCRPRRYLDTLSMARALTQSTIGRSSLAAVADYLGLGRKGDEVVHAKGKRLADFDHHSLSRYADYCVKDTELCFAIFERFMQVFPPKELELVDLVQAMFIEPQVTLNPDSLRSHLRDVLLKEREVMNKVSLYPKAVFSSTAKFAALLEEHGVEVPMKLSPTTKQMIPALAKNDRDFKELCTDPSQSMEVQALLAARLQVKSTIEVTRTVAFHRMTRLTEGRHAFVPLRYAGAHTGRLSGDGGYNWQNLRRGSALRAAVEAPPGMVIVHRDSSQIEARMNAWQARCQHLLEAFEQGRDVYSEFATEVYQRLVTKADKLRRFVGKTGILGLGYGCGAPKFRHMLFIGNGGVSYRCELDEAADIVKIYRRKYREIQESWMHAGWVVAAMRNLQRGADRRGPKDIRGTRYDAAGIWLPNDLCVAYPHLRSEAVLQDDGTVRDEWFYKGPFQQDKKIYGAKVIENICQALARVVVTDAAIRVRRETGFRPWLTTHDSLDYCVPKEDARAFDAYLGEVFATRPTWAPDLPLASEGGWGRTLAIAEDEHHPEHNE